MKRYLLVLLVIAGTAHAKIPGDKQLAFAEYLAEQNEPDAALIEYHRFLFFYPNHPKAADSLYEMSRLLLTVRNDIPAARMILERLVADFPGAEVGVAAKTFLDFVSSHSDFKGEPLFRWLTAKTQATNGQYAKAAEGYRLVALDFPRAKITHDALYRHAMLLLVHLKKFNDAEVSFSTIVNNFPRSKWAPHAYLGLARVVEATEGPGSEALKSYRAVMARFPGTPVAEEALARATAIEKSHNAIPRHFKDSEAVKYRIVSTRPDEKNFIVFIEFAGSGTPNARQIQATLEHALARTAGQRPKNHLSVRVRAYFRYPFTEAGSVDWKPGQGDPTYNVIQRKNEDVLKDALFDLLKSR